MCVKPPCALIRVSKCGVLHDMFCVHLGPFWVHFGSKKDHFGVHFGSIWDTDASLGFRVQGLNQYLDKNEYLDKKHYLDKNQLLDKNTLQTRTLL